MNKTRTLALSLLLAVSSLATPAFAGWQSFPAAGVRFYVPDGWMTQSQNNVIVTRAPSGGTAIEFVAVLGAAQSEAAERQMLQGLQARLDAVQITRRAVPIAQHGMNGFVFGGTARARTDGALIEWYSVVVGSGPRGVLALVVGRAGTLEAYMPIVRPVLDSISLAQ